MTTSVFEVTAVSTLGGWLVQPTTNASIQSIHAIPDVIVNYPAVVPSGQVDVTLDASPSHSVFEPSTAAPAQVRMIAPRFRGSTTPSTSTRRPSGRASASADTSVGSA